ncbi:MAG: YjbH domain-containing protein [Porticoccaceae bacterium]
MKKSFFDKCFSFSILMLSICISGFTGQSSAAVNDLNYLGTSGLFYIPTGTTLGYGEFHFSHTNMVDVASYRSSKLGESDFEGRAFSFAASPFPGLEIGMSNMGYDSDSGSDLIANFKYSPTFIPKNWFDLSIGAIDLGGVTGYQRALYGAVSKEVATFAGDFRFTLGSGSQSQQQTVQRYEGGFAGIEYQPLQWLTAVAEHDGVNNHYGLKVHTPKSWLGNNTQIYGSAILQTDIDNTDTRFFGVGIRTSLFSSLDTALDTPKQRQKTIKKQFPWLIDDSRQNTQPLTKAVITENINTDIELQDNLDYLRRALIKQGFEAVWVSEDDGVLSIGFENPVFNRNEIDALGVAMGIAVQITSSDIKFLDLTLSKYGVATLQFSTSISLLRNFYQNNAKLPPLKPLIARSVMPSEQSKNGSYFIPRISFSPKIRHFIGTEMGMLDYSVALRTNFEVPLWSGGVFYADYDYQMAETEDFKRGKSFYRWSIPSRWSNFSFKQLVKMPLNIYTSVGLGRFRGIYSEEYDGIFSETFWQSPDGTHSLSFSGGYYDSRVFSGVSRDVGIGRYRYYWEDLDLAISLESGQYWMQDQGSKFELTFNFGDTKAHFYVHDTDHQFLGFGFSMPLGVRKDRQPRQIQLRGVDSYYLSTSTMINSEMGCNCLYPGQAQKAPYGSQLPDQYFNNDRLNIRYIRSNQQRLRDAYFNWTSK